MSDFKFTPGEYKTRDGRKAVVLCDDAPGFDPLIGYVVVADDMAHPVSWRVGGRYIEECEMPEDLIPPEAPSDYDKGWNDALEFVARIFDPLNRPGTAQDIRSLKKP